MKIFQVNHIDLRGGAALIAWNLFRGYRNLGHDSHFLVGLKTCADPDVIAIPSPSDLSAYVHRLNVWAAFAKKRGLPTVFKALKVLAEPARLLSSLAGREEFQYPGFSRWLKSAAPYPDIFHMHNLHYHYFDLRTMPNLSHQFPVLITMHDTWLLSGHCAYFIDCLRWQTGCGHCPYLSLYPPLRRDGSAANWRARRKIFASSQLYLAAPSQWAIDQAERSMLWPGVRAARVIPNGIDLDNFKPSVTAAPRQSLGLPADAIVVLFAVNRGLTNKFKDYETLRRAVAAASAALPDKDLIFLALGDDAPPERLGSAELRFLPYRQTPVDVARVYQAADVYIHAACADTYPTTILEAQACGLPVVATAVGGIPEQIADGENGFLTPPGDAVAMSSRIVALAQDPALRQKLGATALTFARRCHDKNRMIAEYLDYYAWIIQDWRAHQ